MNSQNPDSENDQDILNNMILTHWNHYCPVMLAQFRRENRLEEALKAKKESITDLMYELTIIQKISYPTAREIAIHDLLEREEESSSMNPTPNLNPPATSE